jgi:hypothetical protein
MAALDRGIGPASGVPLACTESSSLGAYCGGNTPLGQPASGSAYGFQPATTNGTPPSFYGASLAWDADDGVVLFFGGYNEFTSEPQNETWAYHNGVWANWTLTVGPAPSPRYLAAMAWDNWDGWVVLFGGCGEACPLGDTWVFFGDQWLNYTNQTGAPSAIYSATMTGWSGSDNGTFMFGGCENLNCSVQSNITYSFQDSFGCSKSCWIDYGVSTLPSARAGVALGEDQRTTEIVLFGGYDGDCSSGFFTECNFHALNDTWIWRDSGWVNVTYVGSSVFSYPDAPRAFAEIFWDPYLGQLFLYGGSDAPSLTLGGPPFPSLPIFDELWAYNISLESWVNDSATFALPMIPRVAAAVADSAKGAPPVLVGGQNYATGGLNDTYAWEGPVVTALVASPSSPETNSTVTFNGSAAQAQAPYFDSGLNIRLSFGDGSSEVALNTTHVYTQTGTYSPQLQVFDYLGIFGAATTSVSVRLFSVTASAASNGADVGIPLEFTATSSGGVGPYVYEWTFSGGGASTGATASHAFASTGVVAGFVSVSDATGTVVNESVTATINPVLQVSADASPTEESVGAPINFTANVSGGTPPFTYQWRFGDGGSSTVAAANHPYDAGGAYTADLWVNDSGGGSNHTTLTISIDAAPSKNVPSNGSSGVPFWLWIVLVVVIVAAVAVALGVVARRSKPGPSVGSPPLPPSPSQSSGVSPPTPPGRGPPPGPQ